MGRRFSTSAASIAIAAYCAAIILLLIARFNGINDVILPFLQKAPVPSLYALDPGIRRSLVPGSSHLFDLIAEYRIDLTHPAFIIGIYIAACLLSARAVDLISRDIFGITRPLLRLFILFAALFADAKLINLNKSSWILDHNFSFTFLAASLRFWCIYFFLRGNPVAMAFVLIPINILSFKVGWPVTLMVIALLVYRRERSPLGWGALLLSMVAPAMSALASPVFIAPEEAARMFDILRTLHASEDNPFLGPPLQLLLFPLGCAWAWHMSKAYPETGARLRIALAIGALIFAGGGIALTAAPVKLPLLVLLSPARALETASFLVYLFALVHILTTPHLSTAQRCCLLMGLIVLKLTPGYSWVMLSALFVLSAALLRWLERNRPRADRDPIKAAIAIALIAPLIGIFFAFNLAGNRAQQRYDAAIGFHDHRTPADARAMLGSLATEPGDRRIIFAIDGQPPSARHWNRLARKSGITGDPYYQPRLADIERQIADNSLFDKVQKGLATGRLDDETRHQLVARKVSLILPQQSREAAGGWPVVRRYGEWVELSAR